MDYYNILAYIVLHELIRRSVLIAVDLSSPVDFEVTLI